MSRRPRYGVIFSLPFATALFIVGWILNNTGSHKTAIKAKSKQTKTASEGIEFEVCQSEAQEVVV
jgi:hypothetical protein